ncbi:hypothetical protein PVL29_007535 [Vitis rotundifolia]|uniref:Uncharacterized protein n=1 Tax=Vitis rotundifolia TaxID=103349 RepID=A0AA39A137_VITRO|nr:hypothetical protein PVL29_007535 [Vitis rotundifolia]
MIKEGRSLVSSPPVFSNDAKKLLVCTGNTYCWTFSLDETVRYWDFSLPELMKTVDIQLPIFSMTDEKLLIFSLICLLKIQKYKTTSQRCIDKY